MHAVCMGLLQSSKLLAALELCMRGLLSCAKSGTHINVGYLNSQLEGNIIISMSSIAIADAGKTD